MRRLAAAAAVLLSCVGLGLAGAPVMGHALLTLGFPSAAAVVFADPRWKGMAYFAAGRFDAAAAAFGDAPANAYNRGDALARAGRYAEAIRAFDEALSFEPDNEDAAVNKALLSALASENQAHEGDDAINPKSAASRTRKAHEAASGDESGGLGEGFSGDREGASNPGAKGSSTAGKIGKGEAQADEAGEGQGKGSASATEGLGRTGGQQVDVAKLLQERNRRMARRMEARSVQPTPEWLETLPDDPGRFLKLRIQAEKTHRKAGDAAPETGPN